MVNRRGLYDTLEDREISGAVTYQLDTGDRIDSVATHGRCIVVATNSEVMKIGPSTLIFALTPSDD